MKIALRAACAGDFIFARNLYFLTMRGIIGQLFGWDQEREERNFAGFFKVDEVRIITADEENVGWIQEQVEDRTINLGSFYMIPEMQRRGIGTKVLNILLASAADQSKAVNPGWGKPVHVPVLITEFERQVERLGLTNAQYADSPELRHWCDRNRNRRLRP